MACSDWRQRLRRASFRGASFWVDQDSFQGGRRVVIHEFPHKEKPYLEDLGQQARRYQVTAYTVGDRADSQALALISACTAPRSAGLVLPIFGSLRAACLDVSTDRSKDRHGFVAFKLTFVEEGSGPGPFSVPALGRLVEVAASQMLSPIEAAFRSSFEGLNVPEFVAVSASNTLAEFAAVLDDERARTPIADMDQAAALRRDVQLLHDDAIDLVRQGELGHRFGPTSFIAQESTVADTGIASRVFGLLQTLRVGTEAIDAAPALAILADFETSDAPVPLTTLNRKREAQNRETLLSLFRRSALVQWAVAVTQRDFDNRRQAINARAQVAERFEAELAKIEEADQFEVYIEMSRVMGLTVDYLSKLMADLAPIMVVEAQRSLPAIYWASRLYGDASRGEEISRRNEVKHPTFMPAQFEALSA